MKNSKNIQNVLYVAAKWPQKSKSNDGGDTTINEVISSLSPCCTLDLLCFRDDIKDNATLPGINRVFITEKDFACFQTYSDRRGEKFFTRVEQAKEVAKEIRKIEDRYQLIIVQHVSLILNLGNDIEIMNKLVLLPMFTSTSYEKAGEYVPDEYKILEKRCISLVYKIITPSYVERNILVKECGVDSSKICVIPRSLNCTFHERKLRSKKISLVYVASVRLQKNHLCALRVVDKLRKIGYEVSLICIGAIQDKMIFKECLSYINERNLMNEVTFVGNLSYVEMEKIMNNCTINISVSNWETFGRGIYEGMAMGLPTVVFSKLECVLQAENIGVYPLVANSENDMVERIIKLSTDNDYYEKESNKGRTVQKVLSFEQIKNNLKIAILE